MRYNGYMPEINKQEVHTTKRRVNRKIKTKLIAIVFIVAAIVIFTNVGKQIYQMLQLKKKAELVETELKNLQDENATLLTVKTKLQDPNYVTTYARGEYMFSKGDEKLFYLPASSDEEEVKTEEQTNTEEQAVEEQTEEQTTEQSSESN